jgi:glucokinase
MRVLVGDIGGTNTRLAMVEVEGRAMRVLARRSWPSATFDGLAEAIQRFRDSLEAPVAHACLAVPCPVREGRCDFPNLDWTLDAEELRRSVDLDAVTLLNDFSAVALAVETLEPEHLVVLHEGEPDPYGCRAVVGAGTGLGHAFLTWEGPRAAVERSSGRWRVHESEGGHVDFAPSDEREGRLAAWLAERHGRASAERVVSGPGLEDVYDFLVEDEGAAAHPELPETPGERAAVVHRIADAGDPLARTALDLFQGAYGAHAGDFALSVQATGGVWIAGGIAPRMVDQLREGPFLRRFLAKGRMAHLVEAMSVLVVTNPDVGLRGAALAASRRAG